MVYKGLECESSEELSHSGRRECLSVLTPASAASFAVMGVYMAALITGLDVR